MTDLFLSYKAEDRSRIVPLVRALEQDGLSVWWDAQIDGGDQWRETILRHLEAARAVLVVWSKRSVGPEGAFVRDEATRAVRMGTYLPVRIDDVEPPLGFGETQSIDLRGWNGRRKSQKYQSLLLALTAKLKRPMSVVAQKPRPSVAADRRTVIAGGAAAVLAGGAVTTWLLLRGAKTSGGGSIAVLPFANLSGNPEQSYFSDGIAEELRTVLSRIPELQVVARTSSEAVRDADARTAAAKLHVSNILAGSVRRSASTIRIAAQLIDGADGTERWSEVYDRPIGDMLQIQTEIATMVAQSLSIHLEGSQQRALSDGGTRNAAAQDLLLQAQGVMWRNDDLASLRRAIEYVDRSLSLDPRYADAVAAKAAITNAMGSFFAESAGDSRHKMRLAAALACQSVRLAPRSAMARAALAGTLWNSLRLRQGMAEFEEAAKLSGGHLSFFNGFDPYGLALVCCRRFDAAIARGENLVATDPLNPNAFLTKGVVLVHSKRYEEAYDAMAQAIALGPQLSWPRAFQGLCLMQSGKLEEARRIFDGIAEHGAWLSYAAILAARQNREDDASRLLSLMRDEMGDAGYFQYAEVFAQRGQRDDALDALEKGWNSRDPGLPFMNVDAMLDPIRSDLRFKDLVSRLNFPDGS